MQRSPVLYLLAVFVIGAGCVAAQDTAQALTSVPNATGCNRLELATAANLDLKQRVCFLTDRLINPAGVLRGAFASAFSQWRNVPFERHEDMDDMGHRFAVFYARRAAQGMGELAAGYLNHEDPRLRSSNQNGFWQRTRSALMSVVVVDGSDRLALAPVAGAFGSGFTGMACFRTHNSLGDAFSSTGLVYGGYFGRALAHEFHPDIQAFAYRVLRRKQD